MAKKLIGKRELKKINDDRALLVEGALGLGNFTKRDICKATGLTMVQLNNLFKDNRELYAKYSLFRRTITDTASDNIVDIVNDKNHPKHYDASKFVLQNFKSDLDETLEAKDSDVLNVNLGSVKDPVQIVFSGNDKNDK